MDEIDLSAVQTKAEQINAAEHDRRRKAAVEASGQLKQPPEHDDDIAMLRLVGLDSEKYERESRT